MASEGVGSHLDILWGKRGNSPSVLRHEMCHKKISKRHATNTTNKTNVGPHGTSVAKHHADLCEKIQLAIRSRKKFAFVRGNSPSWSRPQPAPSKTRGIKSSPPLHKKKRSKTMKNRCAFLSACDGSVLMAKTLRPHACSFA
jgi:hypothetical protein